MTDALVAIDVQVGVVAGCHDAEAVVARIARLVDRARSAGVPVVWVQDASDFAPGTAAWEIVPTLRPQPEEALVHKSYRDAFVETGLRTALADAGASRLVVVGTQTDHCVRSTAQRAAVEGFDVTLVGDAHTTRGVVRDDVVVTAEQIIAHTNHYWAGLRYPGQRFDVVDADAVVLTRG
ncbi:isochorismatase family protein [Curtobacterium luteum]|uniref:isochorismatase family protein n=1 Tax=Curtobacterium luteum TaxID=33881 RepID=UPI00380A07E8